VINEKCRCRWLIEGVPLGRCGCRAGGYRGVRTYIMCARRERTDRGSTHLDAEAAVVLTSFRRT